MRSVFIMVCIFLAILPSCMGEDANTAIPHHDSIVFKLDQVTSEANEDMPIISDVWNGEHVHQDIPGLEDVLVFYTLGAKRLLDSDSRYSSPREGLICAYDFGTGMTATTRMPVDCRLMMNTERNQPILLESSYFGLNMHMLQDTYSLTYDDDTGITALEDGVDNIVFDETRISVLGIWDKTESRDDWFRSKSDTDLYFLKYGISDAGTMEIQLVRGNADECIYRHIDTVENVVPGCCVSNSNGRITWCERESGDPAMGDRYRLYVLSESGEVCLDDEQFVPRAVCWLNDDDVLYWGSPDMKKDHYSETASYICELRVWHVDDGTSETVLAEKDNTPIRTSMVFNSMVIHPDGNYIAVFCQGRSWYSNLSMRVGCFEIICIDSGDCYAVIPWCEALDVLIPDPGGEYLATAVEGGYGYSRNGLVFYNPSYCARNDLTMAWIVK